MSDDNVIPFRPAPPEPPEDDAMRTRLLEQVAERTVQEALSSACNKIFTEAALLHPTGQIGTTVTIYLQAVRAHLEWMEAGGAPGTWID